jgi:lipoteichoic acid synthase
MQVKVNDKTLDIDPWKWLIIEPWKWVIIGCLVAKPLIFYNLMNFQTNFIFIWLSTSLMLILFFGSFRNLWIPFGIYTVLTFFMLCDVTFNAYFNGYFSVTMLGSGKYIKDVIDIIAGVIRPSFFLLFLDIPILIAALIHYKTPKDTKKWPRTMIMAGLILLLVFGSVTGNLFLQSIGNLEFTSYHIRDILRETLGFDKRNLEAQEGDLYEITEIEGDALFGIAEGKNLIVIQMEAMQNFVINTEYEGQEITPVLNSLIADEGTLYFDHYYMQIAAGNTSDAEFATNNSLYGTANSYTYEIYKENRFRGLPILLKEIGYRTIAMHGNDGDYWSRNAMYPAQGFDTFLNDTYYKPSAVQGWGILDEEFYQQSVAYLAETHNHFIV